MAQDDWSNEDNDEQQTFSAGYSLGHIVSEIENIFGRQPINYLAKLTNDALLEIGSKRQHADFKKVQDLVSDKRWYPLDSHLIDIMKIEIKDSNGRYVMIPKLSDPHTLLKGDDDNG